MAGSRIAGDTLADEGAHVVVRHLLAPVLGHGWTPFEHAFESSPNCLRAQPMCSFIKNLCGQPRMERRSGAAEDRLPLGRSRDDVRSERAPRHPARSGDNDQPLSLNQAVGCLREILFGGVHVMSRRDDEDRATWVLADESRDRAWRFAVGSLEIRQL